MISVSELTKKYANNEYGIRNVYLDLEEGQVVSIIGPNGVGKSTLLNVLAGRIKQEAGNVCLNGEALSLMGRRNQFGFMPDSFEISERITCGELLKLVDDFRFNGSQRVYIEQSIDKMGMRQWYNVRVKDLSLGNKKKLSMIIAFMNLPQMIILDEPTNGIDAAGIIYLKEMLNKAKDNKRVVVISSHILSFLEEICDRFFYMKDGEILCEICDKSMLEQKYKELYMEDKL